MGGNISYNCGCWLGQRRRGVAEVASTQRHFLRREGGPGRSLERLVFVAGYTSLRELNTGVEVAALQEVRRPGNSTISMSGYTYYWLG